MRWQDVLPLIPDDFFDLAIVDPPYGLGNRTMKGGRWADRWRLESMAERMTEAERMEYATKKKRPKGTQKRRFGTCFNQNDSYNHKRWDDEKPGSDYFAELFRVSRHQVIWGMNYFVLPPCRCPIVWDKAQTVDNFSAVEIAWTSFDKPAAIYRQANHGMFRDSKTIHPTQKPVNLYAWILGTYAKPGWRILDTHLGSGTHRRAAWSLGFDFWGIEVDPEYFAAQEKEFRIFASEPELFAASETYKNKQFKLFDDAEATQEPGT